MRNAAYIGDTITVCILMWAICDLTTLYWADTFGLTPGSGFEPERPKRDSDSRGHRICPLCHPGTLSHLHIVI